MLGAIIGDIVGSRFEFLNHRSKEFDLFTKECFVTDDTVMTLAVAKAIMETEKEMKSRPSEKVPDAGYYEMLRNMTVKYMQEIGRKYPHCGYGGLFTQWVFCDHPQPYQSYGNGAAMHISPVGFIAITETEAVAISQVVTAVTHNHPEGLKGAEAITMAIFMARQGYCISEIQDRIGRDYYPLNFTIADIRSTYQFNETCQRTVPQSLKCFFESKSYEDAIRTAISLGGDSDTIAAITGAVAEAYYGIPNDFRIQALGYLDIDLHAIFNEWEAFAGRETKKL